MAIEIVIGNVGSGKTYYATYRIWQEIKKIYAAEIKGYDYKYKRILTNIEGIQPNKYLKLLKVDELIKLYEEELKIYQKWEATNTTPPDFNSINFNDKNVYNDIEKLKEKELVERCPILEDNIREYKKFNDKVLEHIKIQNDKELAYIEYTKPIFEKAGYSDALIVIDEAHNYFKTLSAAKQRLISYHRHYDQDYIFITQDLKQLNNKITGIALKTIKASNPVMKVGKTFTYKVYSGGYVSYRDTNLLEKIKLKADEDIFKLYHSGSSKQQKSYALKVLLKPFLLLLLVITGIISYIHFLKSRNTPAPGEHHKTVKHISSSVPHKKTAITHISNEDFTLITVTKIGQFYIYKQKKYYWIDFRKALNKCKARFKGMQKNLDSTLIISYYIKDPECLDTALSSLSSF